MFLITSGGAGIGGHLYSLREITNALRPHIECMLVTVGRANSPVLAGLPGSQDVISHHMHEQLNVFKRLCGIVRKDRPDVLHAFDPRCYFWARLLAWRFRKPLLFTKSGGPPPAGYWPDSDHTVLYSEEDLEYFQAHPRYKHGSFHLIPNRANETPQNAAKIARLRNAVPPGSMIFLRIARVCSGYEESIQQSVRLVKRLRQDGLAASFLGIGVVQEPSVHLRLENDLGPWGRFLTDLEHTRQASELLDAADFVIGTGRGFMEAASRGRVLLAPVAGASIPVLVTPQNWRYFARANFSSRAKIPGLAEEANYALIREAMTVPEKVAELRAFARSLFDERFSLTAAVPKYLDLYKQLQPGRTNFRDLFVHWLRDGRRL